MTETGKTATKIEALLDIKYEALYLQQQIIEGRGDFGCIREAFLSLVERFYRENKERITPRQYETARGSYEYFMVCVEMLLSIYKEEE